MVRPLGLPVGSVRALLLLALASTAVLVLRVEPHTIPPWLVVSLLLAAASYFGARSSATDGAGKPRSAPLGLPAGTVRFLFLVVAAYGVYLWFRFNETAFGAAPVVWVLLGYFVGLVVHIVVSRRRGRDEAGASLFEQVLALVSLLAAAGLVWLAADPAEDMQPWVEPLLGSIVVHYFATR